MFESSQQKRAYFRRKLLHWYSANARAFPWRGDEDPFRVLLAEILLQRTQARQVRDHFERIARYFPSPAALAASPVEAVSERVKPLGLAKRAPLLKRLGEELLAKYEGQVPRDMEQLKSLPGVGRYTASATACFAFGVRTAAVDANVVRVFRRFFGIQSMRSRARDDNEIWGFAQGLVPQKEAKDYNRALIDFASTVCQPRLPRCHECPLRRRCLYFTGDGRTKP